MAEKRKRVEIENGHDGVYPSHGEELTPGCSANNRTVVKTYQQLDDLPPLLEKTEKAAEAYQKAHHALMLGLADKKQDIKGAIEQIQAFELEMKAAMKARQAVTG